MGRVLAIAVACVIGSGVTSSQGDSTPVPEGLWGGQGIELIVTADGARIDYGCDSGTIDERLVLDGWQRFAARGTHAFGRGGPRTAGDPPRTPHAARYEGTVEGDAMRLTVVLPDLKRTVGEFTLELDRRPVLERCG